MQPNIKIYHIPTLHGKNFKGFFPMLKCGKSAVFNGQKTNQNSIKNQLKVVQRNRGIIYYIYYLLYRWFNSQWIVWRWSDLKAYLFISALEVYIVLLMCFRIPNSFISQLEPYSFGLITCLPPFLLNYFLFQHNDRSKTIISNFKHASKKEKRKMNLQLAIVILTVGGFVAWLLSL